MKYLKLFEDVKNSNVTELEKFIEYLEGIDSEELKNPSQVKEYLIGICKSIQRDLYK